MLGICFHIHDINASSTFSIGFFIFHPWSSHFQTTEFPVEHWKTMLKIIPKHLIFPSFLPRITDGQTYHCGCKITTAIKVEKTFNMLSCSFFSNGKKRIRVWDGERVLQVAWETQWGWSLMTLVNVLSSRSVLHQLNTKTFIPAQGSIVSYMALFCVPCMFQ